MRMTIPCIKVLYLEWAFEISMNNSTDLEVLEKAEEENLA